MSMEVREVERVLGSIDFEHLSSPQHLEVRL